MMAFRKIGVFAALSITVLGAQAEGDLRLESMEKRVEAIEQQIGQTRAAHHTAADGLPLHGFADVSMFARNGNGKAAGAAVGSLDLYLTPSFGDRVKSLVELVFEVEEGAGELLTDLERVQVGYTFSDAATVWLGRFHTPYGFWNTGFHHGQQIQVAATRPRFIDFEDKGGILPAHATGLWANGAINTGPGKFSYDYYLSNAPEIGEGETAGKGVLDMKMGGKSGAYAAMNGINLTFRPAALLDLALGVHALGGKIAYVDAAGAPTQVNRLRVSGAWLYFQGDQLELIGEYYGFNNEDPAGKKRSSNAGFAQLAYSLGDWTPYARIEKTGLDQSDPYFALQANGNSYGRNSLGLRFELNTKATLKIEGGRTRFTDAGNTTPAFNETRVQMSVRF